jgi:GntR family transcriptional regulator
MTEHAYVTIAGKIARGIRSGVMPAETQLPSYSVLAKQHNVSEIVIRKAIDLLSRQGLVYTVERRGTFVAERPTLVRVSPERQLEDPEDTFGSEAAGGDDDVRIERDSASISASDDIAAKLGMNPGDTVEHVVTRASEGGRPISISDSYQPPGADVAEATVLEETVSDREPDPAHAEWLGVPPGEFVKAVYQRFLLPDGQVLMIADVSYPKDRYDSFKFRMALDRQP